MLARPLRALLPALLATVPCACRVTGTSLLFFGGEAAPQEELLECVEDAREECAEASADFAAGFLLYQRLTAPQAVELDDLSDDFEDALDTCRERARELAASSEAVQKEADALFKGWSAELARFSGDTLRQKSATMLEESETRARRVTSALERVRARMEPVLLKLQDYALFFHHNLNPRAIATLQDTYTEFDAEFRALATELDRAGLELDAFLAAPEPAAGARE